MTPEYAWTHREGRRARYEGKRVGGTVVVHFIKKNMWYLETALALLEGEEESESEKYEASRRAAAAEPEVDGEATATGVDLTVDATAAAAAVSGSHVQARTRKLLRRRPMV